MILKWTSKIIRKLQKSGKGFQKLDVAVKGSKNKCNVYVFQENLQKNKIITANLKKKTA
jgi:hypothetical protein